MSFYRRFSNSPSPTTLSSYATYIDNTVIIIVIAVAVWYVGENREKFLKPLRAFENVTVLAGRKTAGFVWCLPCSVENFPRRRLVQTA